MFLRRTFYYCLQLSVWTAFFGILSPQSILANDGASSGPTPTPSPYWTKEPHVWGFNLFDSLDGVTTSTNKTLQAPFENQSPLTYVKPFAGSDRNANKIPENDQDWDAYVQWINAPYENLCWEWNWFLDHGQCNPGVM